MEWIVFLFGSGLIFFPGVFCILASMAVFSFSDHKRLVSVATLAAVAGLVMITASATPLPVWLFAIGAAATVLWVVAERSRAAVVMRRRIFLRAVVAIAWLIAIGFEVSFILGQSLTVGDRRETLYVIGDSVTAGIGGGEKGTWPQRVAERCSVKVVDLAQPGATAKSALQQADGLPVSGGLILLEIGGNDLLGSTSATQFEKDLEQLLKKVCVEGREVVMMELPLPPLCGQYGRIQRNLAAKFNVKLIPKRVFISVLTGPDATLDSIHLSKEGHQRMASALSEWLYHETSRVP